MNTNLLPEEQLIINCLRQYDCLKKEQLINLVYYKPREMTERIINSLVKRQLLLIDETGTVKHDPRCSYNYKTEIAFWILLKYISVINPEDHYKANYPSEIYFLKDKNQYEIIVLRSGEEHLLGPLANSDRASIDDEESDEMRYIVAVPSESMIPICKSRLKGFKTLFVVYDEGTVHGNEPALSFIKG